MAARVNGFNGEVGKQTAAASKGIKEAVAAYSAAWAAETRKDLEVARERQQYHEKTRFRRPKYRVPQQEFAISVWKELDFLHSPKRRKRVARVLAWLVGEELANNGYTYRGAEGATSPELVTSIEMIYHYLRQRDELNMRPQTGERVGAISSSILVGEVERQEAEGHIAEALNDICRVLDSRWIWMYNPPIRPVKLVTFMHERWVS